MNYTDISITDNKDRPIIYTNTNIPIDLGNAIRLLVDLVENEEWHNALSWINKIPFESIQIPEYQGTYLWAKAKCLDFLGEDGDIENLFLQSVHLHNNSPNPFPLIRSLVSLSSYYCYSRRAKKAKPLLEEALNIVNNNDIHGHTKISVLYAMGIMYGRLHQHEKALQYFHEIESLNKKSNIYSNSGSYLMAIGYSSIFTNDYVDAEHYYNRAHTIFSTTNDIPRVGICCKYLSIVYREMHRYYLAHQYLKQAMDIFFSHNLKQQYHKCQVELIVLLMKTNKLDEAKQRCYKLLSKPKAEIRAEATYLLSQIFYTEGTVENSLEYLDAAIPILKEIDHHWLPDAIALSEELQIAR